MKREIIITADGSTSFHIPEWNEQYHSKHGAIQEANHVFINSGLAYILQQQAFSTLRILEAGFGTGLNAFLTAIYATKHQQKISYTGIEAFPLAKDEWKQLNYTNQFSEHETLFQSIGNADWEKQEQINSYFSLQKQKKFFQDIHKAETHHLIYFDAFGARVQPELWEEPVFEKMYHALKPKGILVTYSAKGSAKRAMQRVGFRIEKLPGPPGKREMMRAIK